MKKYDNQKFEFLLKINGNIICQRYFSIKGFNYRSIRSIELKECAYDVVNIIQYSLKEKAEDYLWKYYNMYEVQKPEDVVYKNVFEKEDVFDLVIKVDGREVSVTRFSGNFFPPKIRYSVDIRSLVPTIIKEIQYYLSRRDYTREYLGTEL
tara:strand:+ start:3627 stop:4079 length:453 start_codon:yes stop_codon:yes gene_type:complete